MLEASKTNALRGPEYFDVYFAGRVLDIGCGSDPVTPTAIPFDLVDGDAERIDETYPSESVDCVHSSHCLEHMSDPEDALRRWWSLVRPGGYMVTVVPHEDLYEQGIWPSQFNQDHKATFRIGGAESWSPVSRDVLCLFGDLPDHETLRVTLMDQGYDYRMQGRGIGVWGRGLHYLNFLRGVVFRKIGLERSPSESTGWMVDLDIVINQLMWRLGGVPDQTVGHALAQIEIVSRKRLRSLSDTGT